MFAIKVFDAASMEYSMYSTRSYKVSSMYKDNNDGTAQSRDVTLVLDPAQADGPNRVVLVPPNCTAYVMNNDGKTIDTI